MFNPALVDPVSSSGAATRNRNRLVDGPHFHGQVDLHVLPEPETQTTANQSLEPRRLGDDLVVSGYQEWHQVKAVGARYNLSPDIGVHIGHGDGHLCNDGRPGDRLPFRKCRLWFPERQRLLHPRARKPRL